MNLLPEQTIVGRSLRLPIPSADCWSLIQFWLNHHDPTTQAGDDAKALLRNSPALLLATIVRAKESPSILENLIDYLQVEFADEVRQSNPKHIKVKAKKRIKQSKALAQFCKVATRGENKKHKKWWNGVRESLDTVVSLLAGKDNIVSFSKSISRETQRWIRHLYLGCPKSLGKQVASNWLDDWTVDVELQTAAACIRLASMNTAELYEEKLQSMKQLAYGASHEVNNPLANIATRAQVLMMDEEDPSRLKKLAAMEQQAMRAHEMISNMMYYAHPPQLTRAECDLGEVAAQVVSELRADAESQQTAIRTFLKQKPENLVADATQIALAIRLLVQNSMEVLQKGGTIEVGLKFNSEAVQVIVSDDGPGFDDHIARHLFDPFFSGREAGRGLGFGLCKAWRIAKLHGGELVACPTAEGGARFVFSIPRKQNVNKLLHRKIQSLEIQDAQNSPAA